ncbi:dihydrodipicolinate synthase family protein [Oceanospirillum beijerinckii]|uniref:dihydrodipicolinate synthase family protein n=1 Tax=Oceanospirillum beijerinckii TaxID=64976 RepID=UPI00041F57D1|nr:dihydrodipicolinate synthase family protein [Oceanospirillum beijerinckii]
MLSEVRMLICASDLGKGSRSDFRMAVQLAIKHNAQIIYLHVLEHFTEVIEEVMDELAKCANIVAVKESTTDIRRITELYNRFDDRFIVFSGVDDIALESLMLGATGWISGLTNAFPKESVTLYKRAQQGRYAEAVEIYRWFLPLLRLDTIPELAAFGQPFLHQATIYTRLLDTT